MPITGHVRSRFIEAAVLLQLLDPVRGEPSAHGLDQDSHESGTQRGALLKHRLAPTSDSHRLAPTSDPRRLARTSDHAGWHQLQVGANLLTRKFGWYQF